MVQFISRQNDEEATNESIGNLLASQTVSEHVTEIAQEYTVTDVAGELHYLTVPEESTEAAETEGTETTATESTEAAAGTTEAAETETVTETAAETTEAADETTETAAETEETTSASEETTAVDAQ